MDFDGIEILVKLKIKKTIKFLKRNVKIKKHKTLLKYVKNDVQNHIFFLTDSFHTIVLVL